MRQATEATPNLSLRDIQVRAHLARSQAAHDLMRALRHMIRQTVWNTFRRPARRFS